MGLTSSDILAIVIVLVISAVVIGLLLITARRLRERRAKILNDLSEGPRFRSDRAFNRLAMARREASLLAGQGMDVSGAQSQLAQSQSAFDARQFDRSYELAQSAHESLVLIRQRGAAGPLPSSGSVAPRSPDPIAVPLAPSGVPVAAPVPEPSKVPKNRAESQFQLRLVDEALGRGSPPDAAAATARQAHTAFDAGDYTEAFRLALKARRQLGDGVEALAPSPGRAASEPSAVGPRGRADPLRSAESVAAATRCPHCGYPTTPDDIFCRGCGTPRTPTACAQCGTPRTTSDQFCGRCGARFT